MQQRQRAGAPTRTAGTLPARVAGSGASPERLREGLRHAALGTGDAPGPASCASDAPRLRGVWRPPLALVVRPAPARPVGLCPGDRTDGERDAVLERRRAH